MAASLIRELKNKVAAKFCSVGDLARRSRVDVLGDSGGITSRRPGPCIGPVPRCMRDREISLSNYIHAPGHRHTTASDQLYEYRKLFTELIGDRKYNDEAASQQQEVTPRIYMSGTYDNIVRL